MIFFSQFNYSKGYAFLQPFFRFLKILILLIFSKARTHFFNSTLFLNYQVKEKIRSRKYKKKGYFFIKKRLAFC